MLFTLNVYLVYSKVNPRIVISISAITLPNISLKLKISTYSGCLNFICISVISSTILRPVRSYLNSTSIYINSLSIYNYWKD